MRAMYIAGFVMLLTILVSPTVYKFLTKPPTCFDGVQNQGETAIDLGGPCILLNPADLRALNVKWARSFKVVPGVYSSIAYVENPNKDGGIRGARYIFKLYDERNILVAERLGKTFIPPGKVVPIFEGNLQTGGRTPTKTIFQFIEDMTWERMNTDLDSQIHVIDKTLKYVNDLQRLDVKLKNNSVYELRNLVVVATLFDVAGNAIGASRTVIETFKPDSVKDIVFTWPKKFNSFVARIDVVPLLPPEDSLSNRPD